MKITRAHSGILTYTYGNKNFTCVFNTLAEVGQPWQVRAKLELAQMRREGWTIQHGVTLDTKPWVADMAFKDWKTK